MAKKYAVAKDQSGLKRSREDRAYGIKQSEYSTFRKGNQLQDNKLTVYGDIRDSLMRNVEMRKQAKEGELRKESEKNIAGVVSTKARAGRKLGTNKSASLMAALEGSSTRYRGI